MLCELGPDGPIFFSRKDSCFSSIIKSAASSPMQAHRCYKELCYELGLQKKHISPNPLNMLAGRAIKVSKEKKNDVFIHAISELFIWFLYWNMIF